MSLIIPANTLASGGYAVANSCRFDDGSSASMSRDQSANDAGTTTIGTLSVWIKMSAAGTEQVIYERQTDTSNYFKVWFENNKLLIQTVTSGSITMKYETNRLFRDPSAWMSIVVILDSTDGTAGDRQQIWINGVKETSFATSTNIGSSASFQINTGTGTDYIGKRSSGNYFDGYIAEFVWIDGTDYTTTSFGEFDEDSGIWKPIDVSGLTFGTNGFYLDFEDSANLGNDANGGTDFTVANLTAIDQTTDTPTNNFATFNPLDKLTTGAPTGSEGNLKLTGDAVTNNTWNSSIGLSSGKWYVEIKTLQSSPDNSIGFRSQTNTSGSLNNLYGFDTNSNTKIINGSSSGSAIGSTSQNNILGMALDLDNGKMFIHRNGTYLSSGDPSTGDNPFIVTADGMPTEGVIGGHVYNGVVEVNFGNPPFTISSGNTDGNGYGNFEYAVPSGYLSLCTANLSEVLG